MTQLYFLLIHGLGNATWELGKEWEILDGTYDASKNP